MLPSYAAICLWLSLSLKWSAYDRFSFEVCACVFMHIISRIYTYRWCFWIHLQDRSHGVHGTVKYMLTPFGQRFVASNQQIVITWYILMADYVRCAHASTETFCNCATDRGPQLCCNMCLVINNTQLIANTRQNQKRKKTTQRTVVIKHNTNTNENTIIYTYHTCFRLYLRCVLFRLLCWFLVA